MSVDRVTGKCPNQTANIASRAGEEVTGPINIEQQILPEGNIALVTESGSSGIIIQIGKVGRYPYADLRNSAGKERLRSDLESKVVAFGFSYGTDEDAGWIGIKPLLGETLIHVHYDRAAMEPDGALILERYDSRNDFIKRAKPSKTAIINPSIFTSQGLVLDGPSSANQGHVFSREFSQYLFDFLMGQGSFAPHAPQPAS